MLRAYEGKISIQCMGESPVLAIGLYLIGAQSFNANLLHDHSDYNFQTLPCLDVRVKTMLTHLSLPCVPRTSMLTRSASARDESTTVRLKVEPTCL